MKDKLFLLMAVLAVMPFFGCDKKSQQPKSGAVVGEQVVTLYAYGIVEARRHSTLSAQFPGKIMKILVCEGEQVQQGQLLALFEAKELAAQVEVARTGAVVATAALAEAQAGTRPAELAAAKEELIEAEAQLVKADADWQRYRRLGTESAVAVTDVEQNRLRFESAKAKRNAAADRVRLLEEGTRPETIEVLKKRLALAQAEIKRAEASLANARLTAPYDGVITRKHREEGEAMDIGLPVMDIATLNDRYVRAEINETDIGRVKTGQAVEITADGFPGLRFEGLIKEVKRQMGPKLLIPTDPSKIVDYKVLDVEVSLPADCPFPIKLPVNVRISLAETR